VVIAFVGLLVLLVLISSIIFKKKPSSVSPPSLTATPSANTETPPSQPPTPAANIPEGWKIYENKELGFKVAYPSGANWYLLGEGDYGLHIATVPDTGILLANLKELDADIHFGGRRNFEYKSMIEAKNNRSGLINWSESDRRAEYVKEINFQGQFAIERMGKTKPLTEPGYTIDINLIKNGTLYWFSLFSMTKQGLQLHEPTFRKMLESFTFF